MKVIVDTCIWSLVLRRIRPSTKHELHLSALIDKGLVVMLGPIRQEILSGSKSQEQFEILKDYFSAFPDHRLQRVDYEKAAEFYNICRAKGIQGSNTDFLISALAANNNFFIYTTDKDFVNYKKFLKVKLYNYE